MRVRQLRLVFTKKKQLHWLSRFLSQQSDLDKRARLRELSLIVCGIRIFNWEGGKAGEGIEDLPEILAEASKTTRDNVEASKICAADRIKT